MTSPIRPIDVDYATCCVTANRILDIDKILVIGWVIETEWYLALAILSRDIARSYDLGSCTLYIAIKFVCRTFPPPAPVKLIDFISERSINERSCSIDCYNRETQITISFILFFAKSDTHITLIWRVSHRV